MNKLLILLMFGLFTNVMTSQIWEELNMPMTDGGAGGFIQINGKLYELGRDSNDYEKRVNYNFDGENWLPAENNYIRDTLITITYFTQKESDIVVTCRNGIFISLDSAKTWLKQPYLTFGTENNSWNIIEDAAITEKYIYATTDYVFDRGISRYNKSTNSWDWLKDKRQDTTLEMYVQQVETNSTHVFAMQENIVNPRVSNDTLSGGLYI